MARRVLALVMIALGTAGILLAILLPSVVVPASSKTPLNLDITTVATGQAELLDASSGDTRQVTLQSTRVVHADSKASTGDVVVINESLCTMIGSGDTPPCVGGDDPRRLSLTTDRVASDRKTAEAVNEARFGETVNGEPVQHSGLSYKFPIGTEKKTYQLYVQDLQAAFPAEYTGTEKIDGLEVYVFRSDTGERDYQVQGVLPGKYQSVRTLYVEPETGVIVKGVEEQTQTLESGQVALRAALTFDDSSVQSQADYAKNSIRSLTVAGLWAPIGSGVLGLVLLVVGIVLLRRTSSEPTPARRRAGDDQPEPVAV